MNIQLAYIPCRLFSRCVIPYTVWLYTVAGSAGCGIVFPLVRGRLGTAGDRFSVETLRNESYSVSLTLFRGTKSVLAGLTKTGDRNETIARYFVGVQLLRLDDGRQYSRSHYTHYIGNGVAHEHGEATRQETGDWRMSWGPRVLRATCYMLYAMCCERGLIAVCSPRCRIGLGSFHQHPAPLRGYESVTCAKWLSPSCTKVVLSCTIAVSLANVM